MSLTLIQVFGLPVLAYTQTPYADQINTGDYEFVTDNNPYNDYSNGDYQSTNLDSRRADLQGFVSRYETYMGLTGAEPSAEYLEAQALISRIDAYNISPDLANDTALWGDASLDESLDAFSGGNTANPLAYDPVQQGGFTTGGYEGGLSGLYPTKLPNEVNMSNIAIEFTSCIAAMYATNLTKIPIRGVQKVLSSVGQGVADLVDGSGWWTIGTGGLAGAPVSSERTEEDDKKVEEIGPTLLGVQIIPPLNAMAFCAKNMLMAYVSATIIKFVNEGFNKAAIFVEDLESDINRITNIAFAEAIGEVNVCGHIGFTVELSALANALRTTSAAPPNRCTFVFDTRAQLMLEGKIFNYDSFENLYLNPNNNVMGAFLAVDSVYNTKQNNYKQEHLAQLDWGNGILPWKDDQGRTVTPGQFVAGKILKLINQDMETMSFANEWDEVMFILYNQIIKTNISDSLSN